MTAQPLAARLRQATASAHQQAEATVWAGALASGRVPTAAYAAYAAALAEIYRVLESAVETHASHPAVAAVHDPRLTRAAALEADCAAWGAPATTPALSEATHAYVTRLTSAAGTQPHLLIAHHYVRYLGDLSGGQVVAAALRGAGHRDGASFYDFSAVAEPTGHGGTSTVPFVRRYREALDAAPLSEAEAAEVTAEAVRSFSLTTRLFEALEPLVAGSPGVAGSR